MVRFFIWPLLGVGLRHWILDLKRVNWESESLVVMMMMMMMMVMMMMMMMMVMMMMMMMMR